VRFLWKLFISAILMYFLSAAARDFRQDIRANREILVSAAMSLKDACKEIGSFFEKQTGIRVRFNLGASGLLQKQIEAGAPVDVFASAGEKQMDSLQDQGLIIPETRRDFARNSLVLVTPKHSRVRIQSFADLARSGVARVAIGSPKTVPAGQYAEEALRNLKLWNALQPRFVLAENVRQVLDYVLRGEVDAGLVYASDMEGIHAKAVIAAWAPKESYSPIRYPIAVVKGSSEREEAQRFIDLIFSNRGQAILKKYGFLGSQ
jgi:molybdate transport system substrate-binding protein